MKVLAKGRAQSGWSREMKCTGSGNGGGGCGAKLLVEQADLFRTFSSHYDGSTDHYVTFRCAQCGVETDSGAVPAGIEEELPAKKTWLAKQRDPVFGRTASPPATDRETPKGRAR